MIVIKRFAFLFALVFIIVANSYATWSIIVIDSKTGAIGIAGASCTYSVYGIGAIIPGKGAIIVQAMSNSNARVKGLQLMLIDAPPEQIMEAMKNPVFDPEEQQYAIICSKYADRPLTYTGTKTTSARGTLTSKGISVQGNTLSSEDELDAVLKAALQAQKDSLPIEEVLMLALEAGAKYGGDKRCGDRKAASAFLTVANPSDHIKHPWLNLVVYGNNENINAVEALRQKFNQWKNK